MSNLPVIEFETIKDFKKYCKDNNLKPIVYFKAKKHQNLKAEFLHEITGIYKIGTMIISFLIHEMCAFKDKKVSLEEGYKISNIK